MASVFTNEQKPCISNTPPSLCILSAASGTEVNKQCRTQNPLYLSMSVRREESRKPLANGLLSIFSLVIWQNTSHAGQVLSSFSFRLFFFCSASKYRCRFFPKLTTTLKTRSPHNVSLFLDKPSTVNCELRDTRKNNTLNGVLLLYGS